MTRRIVQIETVYDHGENGRYQPHVQVYALWDDGTVMFNRPSDPTTGWEPLIHEPPVRSDKPAQSLTRDLLRLALAALGITLCVLLVWAELMVFAESFS